MPLLSIALRLPFCIYSESQRLKFSTALLLLSSCHPSARFKDDPSGWPWTTRQVPFALNKGLKTRGKSSFVTCNFQSPTFVVQSEVPASKGCCLWTDLAAGTSRLIDWFNYLLPSNCGVVSTKATLVMCYSQAPAPGDRRSRTSCSLARTFPFQEGPCFGFLTWAGSQARRDHNLQTNQTAWAHGASVNLQTPQAGERCRKVFLVLLSLKTHTMKQSSSMKNASGTWNETLTPFLFCCCFFQVCTSNSKMLSPWPVCRH